MEQILELILYFISTIIITFSQVYTFYVVAKFICKENFSYKKLLYSFLIILPIAFITNWLYSNFPSLSFIKSVTIIVAALIMLYFLYKCNITRSIVIIIGSIIPFIFDLLVVLVIYAFSNGDAIDKILNNQIIHYVISSITGVLIAVTLKILDPIINKYSNTILTSSKNIDYKLILSQGLVVFITLIPSMFLLYSNNYNYSGIFLLVNTIQLVIVSIFSFWYIKKRILFKDTELELENTKLHNKALATINESIRGLKHDMGNMVQSINGYLAVGNIDGVKAYCQNLIHGFNDVNLLSILSPKVINDPAIYGVVVSKMIYARDNNLTLSLDVGVDVSQINFPSFELSRIIGILLDNAIEAALESDDKKLKLEMYYDDKRKADIIIIGNSVKDAEKVNVIRMFEKDYSTKENPSGFGLYEVLKFLKKHNKGDIVPNIDYDTNFFTQTLTFDK